MFLLGYVIWNGVDERDGGHRFSSVRDCTVQYVSRTKVLTSREIIIPIIRERSRIGRALLNWCREESSHKP